MAAGPGRRLEGRRMLVTGAAAGIGRAIARSFAGEGARLALVDSDAAGLGREAADLGAAAFVLDLARSEEIAAMVEEAAAAMGGLDGVVNCAGIGMGRPIAEVDLALFAQIAAVNLTAPFMVCRAALPHIRAAGGGTIVNIASGQGLLPNTPNNTVYAATKGGLIAFSKALAAEAAPLVRVNAVCPGITNTAMAAGLFAAYEDPSQAPFVQQYALRRVAEPEEIASAVLFLSSGESSFVTGTAMAVDGGRSFH